MADFKVYFILLNLLFACGTKKVPRPYNQTKPAAKFDNPNYIRDRLKYTKNIISSLDFLPPMQPFHPAWIDYCDPYQCNDYHKRACGLNRNTMRFKWFQSVCHIIYNNLCANYRGSLKYDVVEPKYCSYYVMFLREGCQRSCNMTVVEPVCAVSSVEGHTVLFVNECALEAANCREQSFHEYEEVDMRVCELYALRNYLVSL